MFSGCAITQNPGRPLYPLKAGEGRTRCDSGGGGRDTRLRAYGQHSPTPPRDATSSRTGASQSGPKDELASGEGLREGAGPETAELPERT